MTEVKHDRVTKVERDGLTFDVVDDGPLAGEPIVLLHGFPQRSTSWRYVVPLLNAAGYRTLAMDQRGYSPGARPRSRRAYVSQEVADDAKALIDRVGGSAHVVGHDWGASAAWSVTGRHPDAVRTLTAVSVPHPVLFKQSVLHSTQGLKSWYMGFFQLPVVPELVAQRGLVSRWVRAGGMRDEEVERFQREIVEDGALTTAMNWYRALPFDRGGGGVGRKSTVPTTLVWSDRDIYIGRWAVERTESMVDAPYELVELPGVSHWIPEHAPQELAEAIIRRAASVA